MNSKRFATIAAAVALSAGVAVGTAVPASASHGGDGGKDNSGRCSQGASWKIKAKSDDGRLEVEAEVDTNVSGQTFTWKLADNAQVQATGKSTTQGASGSFSVERRIANQSGSDAIKFTAKNKVNGETCVATVTF